MFGARSYKKSVFYVYDCETFSCLFPCKNQRVQLNEAAATNRVLFLHLGTQLFVYKRFNFC
jgi:hypothetical protein